MRLSFSLTTSLESVYDEGHQLVTRVDLWANNKHIKALYPRLETEPQIVTGEEYLTSLGFVNMIGLTDVSQIICEVEREWLLTHKDPEVRRLAID